jgi:ATP-dependent DNA helicase RecG
VHREYSKGFLAKIVVENERLYAENWNRSSRHGRINPEDFTPDAKNPLLAWFFVNIGRADWMGSGIRNLYKYTKIYSGGEPELIEGDIFKTIIPIKPGTADEDDLHTDTIQVSTQDSTQVSTQVSTQDSTQVSTQDSMQVSTQDTTQDERLPLLLDYCSVPRSRDEMQRQYGVATREYFRKNVLKPLLESGQLKMTIPEKPNSRNQRYVRG